MDKRVIISVLVLVTLGMGIYLYFRQFYPDHNWQLSLAEKSEEPYGLSMLIQMLEHKGGEEGFARIKRSIVRELDTNCTNCNYLVISKDYTIDSLAMLHLKKFMEKGNKAFFIFGDLEYAWYATESWELQAVFSDDRFPYYYEESYADSILHPTLTNASGKELGPFEFEYRVLKKNRIKDWKGVDWLLLDSVSESFDLELLGQIDSGLVNFFSMPVGDGRAYFHFNPLPFTNYHYSKEKGLEYVNGVFSHFNNGKLYWDRGHMNWGSSETADEESGSSLKMILEQPQLRTGWYILLALALLVVVFNSSRKQKAIPVIPPNKNSSIAYAKAVSELFYQNGDHRIIANEMWKHFNHHCRTKFGIPPTMEPEQVIPLLSLKTGIEQEKIAELYSLRNKVEFNPQPEKEDLKQFHLALEYYYKNCKK